MIHRARLHIHPSIRLQYIYIYLYRRGGCEGYEAAHGGNQGFYCWDTRKLDKNIGVAASFDQKVQRDLCRSTFAHLYMTDIWCQGIPEMTEAPANGEEEEEEGLWDHVSQERAEAEAAQGDAMEEVDGVAQQGNTLPPPSSTLSPPFMRLVVSATPHVPEGVEALVPTSQPAGPPSSALSPAIIRCPQPEPTAFDVYASTLRREEAALALEAEEEAILLGRRRRSPPLSASLTAGRGGDGGIKNEEREAHGAPPGTPLPQFYVTLKKAREKEDAVPNPSSPAPQPSGDVSGSGHAKDEEETEGKAPYSFHEGGGGPIPTAVKEEKPAEELETTFDDDDDFFKTPAAMRPWWDDSQADPLQPVPLIDTSSSSTRSLAALLELLLAGEDDNKMDPTTAHRTAANHAACGGPGLRRPVRWALQHVRRSLYRHWRAAPSRSGAGAEVKGRVKRCRTDGAGDENHEEDVRPAFVCDTYPPPAPEALLAAIEAEAEAAASTTRDAEQRKMASGSRDPYEYATAVVSDYYYGCVYPLLLHYLLEGVSRRAKEEEAEAEEEEEEEAEAEPSLSGGYGRARPAETRKRPRTPPPEERGRRTDGGAGEDAGISVSSVAAFRKGSALVFGFQGLLERWMERVASATAADGAGGRATRCRCLLRLGLLSGHLAHAAKNYFSNDSLLSCHAEPPAETSAAAASRLPVLHALQPLPSVSLLHNGMANIVKSFLLAVRGAAAAAAESRCSDNNGYDYLGGSAVVPEVIVAPLLAEAWSILGIYGARFAAPPALYHREMERVSNATPPGVGAAQAGQGSTSHLVVEALRFAKQTLLQELQHWEQMESKTSLRQPRASSRDRPGAVPGDGGLFEGRESEGDGESPSEGSSCSSRSDQEAPRLDALQVEMETEVDGDELLGKASKRAQERERERLTRREGAAVGALMRALFPASCAALEAQHTEIEKAKAARLPQASMALTVAKREELAAELMESTVLDVQLAEGAWLFLRSLVMRLQLSLTRAGTSLEIDQISFNSKTENAAHNNNNNNNNTAAYDAGRDNKRFPWTPEGTTRSGTAVEENINMGPPYAPAAAQANLHRCPPSRGTSSVARCLFAFLDGLLQQLDAYQRHRQLLLPLAMAQAHREVEFATTSSTPIFTPAVPVSDPVEVVALRVLQVLRRLHHPQSVSRCLVWEDVARVHNMDIHRPLFWGLLCLGNVFGDLDLEQAHPGEEEDTTKATELISRYWSELSTCLAQLTTLQVTQELHPDTEADGSIRPVGGRSTWGFLLPRPDLKEILAGLPPNLQSTTAAAAGEPGGHPVHHALQLLALQDAGGIRSGGGGGNNPSSSEAGGQLASGSGTAPGAFGALAAALQRWSAQTMMSGRGLGLQSNAAAAAGVALFPLLQGECRTPPPPPPMLRDDEEEQRDGGTKRHQSEEEEEEENAAVIREVGLALEEEPQRLMAPMAAFSLAYLPDSPGNPMPTPSCFLDGNTLFAFGAASGDPLQAFGPSPAMAAFYAMYHPSCFSALGQFLRQPHQRQLARALTTLHDLLLPPAAVEEGEEEELRAPPPLPPATTAPAGSSSREENRQRPPQLAAAVERTWVERAVKAHQAALEGRLAADHMETAQRHHSEDPSVLRVGAKSPPAPPEEEEDEGGRSSEGDHPAPLSGEDDDEVWWDLESEEETAPALHPVEPAPDTGRDDCCPLVVLPPPAAAAALLGQDARVILFLLHSFVSLTAMSHRRNHNHHHNSSSSGARLGAAGSVAAQVDDLVLRLLCRISTPPSQLLQCIPVPTPTAVPTGALAAYRPPFTLCFLLLAMRRCELLTLPWSAGELLLVLHRFQRLCTDLLLEEVHATSNEGGAVQEQQQQQYSAPFVLSLSSQAKILRRLGFESESNLRTQPAAEKEEAAGDEACSPLPPALSGGMIDDTYISTVDTQNAATQPLLLAALTRKEEQAKGLYSHTTAPGGSGGPAPGHHPGVSALLLGGESATPLTPLEALFVMPRDVQQQQQQQQQTPTSLMPPSSSPNSGASTQNWCAFPPSDDTPDDTGASALLALLQHQQHLLQGLESANPSTHWLLEGALLLHRATSVTWLPPPTPAAWRSSSAAAEAAAFEEGHTAGSPTGYAYGPLGEGGGGSGAGAGGAGGGGGGDTEGDRGPSTPPFCSPEDVTTLLLHLRAVQRMLFAFNLQSFEEAVWGLDRRLQHLENEEEEEGMWTTTGSGLSGDSAAEGVKGLEETSWRALCWLRPALLDRYAQAVPRRSPPPVAPHHCSGSLCGTNADGNLSLWHVWVAHLTHLCTVLLPPADATEDVRVLRVLPLRLRPDAIPTPLAAAAFVSANAEDQALQLEKEEQAYKQAHTMGRKQPPSSQPVYRCTGRCTGAVGGHRYDVAAPPTSLFSTSLSPQTQIRILVGEALADLVVAGAEETADPSRNQVVFPPAPPPPPPPPPAASSTPPPPPPDSGATYLTCLRTHRIRCCRVPRSGEDVSCLDICVEQQVDLSSYPAARHSKGPHEAGVGSRRSAAAEGGDEETQTQRGAEERRTEDAAEARDVCRAIPRAVLSSLWHSFTAHSPTGLRAYLLAEEVAETSHRRPPTPSTVYEEGTAERERCRMALYTTKPPPPPPPPPRPEAAHQHAGPAGPNAGALERPSRGRGRGAGRRGGERAMSALNFLRFKGMRMSVVPSAAENANTLKAPPEQQQRKDKPAGPSVQEAVTSLVGSGCWLGAHGLIALLHRLECRLAPGSLRDETLGLYLSRLWRLADLLVA
eukprot:gene1466-855_t